MALLVHSDQLDQHYHVDLEPLKLLQLQNHPDLLLAPGDLIDLDCLGFRQIQQCQWPLWVLKIQCLLWVLVIQCSQEFQECQMNQLLQVILHLPLFQDYPFDLVILESQLVQLNPGFQIVLRLLVILGLLFGQAVQYFQESRLLQAHLEVQIVQELQAVQHRQAVQTNQKNQTPQDLHGIPDRLSVLDRLLLR